MEHSYDEYALRQHRRRMDPARRYRRQGRLWDIQPDTYARFADLYNNPAENIGQKPLPPIPTNRPTNVGAQELAEEPSWFERSSFDTDDDNEEAETMRDSRSRALKNIHGLFVSSLKILLCKHA
jgi:hypothetical protein